MSDKRNFYDKKYSSFESLPGFRQEEVYCQRIIHWLKWINWWPESDKVRYLDAGCGFGIKTFVFSRYFNQSLGIDFSVNAIEICNRLNNSPGNLTYQVKDIEDISDEKFDMVTAFGLSYFNSRDIEMLAKRIALTANLSLNREGILFISTRTDYSGKSDTGWHNLGRREIAHLKKLLKDQCTGAEVKVIAPDHHIKYLVAGTILHAIGSLRKSILNRPRDLFIIIRYV